MAGTHSTSSVCVQTNWRIRPKLWRGLINEWRWCVIAIRSAIHLMKRLMSQTLRSPPIPASSSCAAPVNRYDGKRLQPGFSAYEPVPSLPDHENIPARCTSPKNWNENHVLLDPSVSITDGATLSKKNCQYPIWEHALFSWWRKHKFIMQPLHLSRYSNGLWRQRHSVLYTAFYPFCWYRPDALFEINTPQSIPRTLLLWGWPTLKVLWSHTSPG